VNRPLLERKYRHGDTRSDGYRFHQYYFRSNRWEERWLSPESFERKRAASNAYHRKKFLEDPQGHNERTRVLAIARKKKDPIKHATRMLYNSAMQRSKKRGTPFDLTREWIQERLDRGVCEISGIPFFFNDVWFTGGRHLASPFIPSIDQIHPGEGYTKQNTQIVCFIYNTAKSVFKHEDVITLAKALISKIS
jgi:hypothetical protein